MAFLSSLFALLPLPLRSDGAAGSGNVHELAVRVAAFRGVEIFPRIPIPMCFSSSLLLFYYYITNNKPVYKRERCVEGMVDWDCWGPKCVFVHLAWVGLQKCNLDVWAWESGSSGDAVWYI